MQRTLVYIMSPSYSGSTLLTRILAEYDQISTIGELKATGIADIDQYHCSCGARFLDCEFWKTLAARLAEQDVALDLRDLQTRITTQSATINSFLTPNLRGPVLETLRQLAFSMHPRAARLLREQLVRNAHIIESICQLQQGDVFLDESKDPLRALYFDRSSIWNFKVVQLVRDGRGTVNSDVKHNHRSVADACAEWNMKIDEMSRFREMASCPILQVSYEKLCTDTEETVADILEFSGIPQSQRERSGERTQHIIGNDMRLAPMRDVKLDEKWRNDLSAEALEVFYSQSGQRNEHLGYVK